MTRTCGAFWPTGCEICEEHYCELDPGHPGPHRFIDEEVDDDECVGAYECDYCYRRPAIMRRGVLWLCPGCAARYDNQKDTP